MSSLIQTKTICTKDNIILSKDTQNNAFHLKFDIENPNIVLPNLITFGIFQLLGELNKDVLESITVTKTYSDSEIDLLYIFKQFGADLGISQKYMHIRVKGFAEDKKITFTSSSSKCDSEIDKELELIENSESTMVVEWEHDHKVHVSYYFSAHVQDNLPIYMENLMGMLTKKMFYRVKTFIENMKI
tara:strand:- start:175 stop:735 length:561 start_codon:yes stop_codon:yes gene_type:complete